MSDLKMLSDTPGLMDALGEWNAARQARQTAVDEYEAARLRAWHALVRMAQAHQRGQALQGGHDIFRWFSELDGDRDKILQTAAAESASTQR